MKNEALENLPKMTDRARMILKDAAQEARKSGVDYVGPEHILLGLLNSKKFPLLRIIPFVLLTNFTRAIEGAVNEVNA